MLWCCHVSLRFLLVKRILKYLNYSFSRHQNYFICYTKQAGKFHRDYDWALAEIVPFEHLGADGGAFPATGRASELLTGYYGLSFSPIDLALVPFDKTSDRLEVTNFGFCYLIKTFLKMFYHLMTTIVFIFNIGTK